MSGIEIEYLLGLYFLIISITDARPLSLDVIRFVAGIILLVLAVLGKSFIGA